jgi:hypothetical protein
MELNFGLLFYKRTDLFDDHCYVFDKKLVTYKIISKIYIKINQGRKVLSDKNYERIY